MLTPEQRDRIKAWARLSQTTELRLPRTNPADVRKAMKIHREYLRRHNVKLRFRTRLEDGVTVIYRMDELVNWCNLNWPHGEERKIPAASFAHLRRECKTQNARAKRRGCDYRFHAIRSSMSVRKTLVASVYGAWAAEVKQVASLHLWDSWDAGSLTPPQCRRIIAKAKPLRDSFEVTFRIRNRDGKRWIQAVPWDHFEQIEAMRTGQTLRVRLSTQQRAGVIRKACYRGLILSYKYDKSADCYEFRRIG